MAKYRKKPVVIEAFQFGVWKKQNEGAFPDWFMEAGKRNVLGCIDQKTIGIKTSEGLMIAVVGDYIIKGIQGELYPCKPDIFEQTYELVEE